MLLSLPLFFFLEFLSFFHHNIDFFEHSIAGTYRTPLSGEGFDTEVFGEKVTVPTRNRRFLNAWDLGVSAVSPGVKQSSILPVATLYFWRRPASESWLFRAVIVGLYNEIMASQQLSPSSGLELIGGFENLTIPFGQSYYIDGRRIDAEELNSGWIRPGVGLGFRGQLKPFDGVGEIDNMWEAGLLFEPAFYYFRRGPRTATAYAMPTDYLELRAHARFRYDALRRNLLELPHLGFHLGADMTQGWRSHWKDEDRRSGEDCTRKSMARNRRQEHQTD